MYGHPYKVNTEFEHMSAASINKEIKRVDNYRITLEKEIEQLRARKKKLEERMPDPECEKMFRTWGGSEIQDSSEMSFCIKFLPHFNGKVYATYSIGLHKLGTFWSLSHHNLPFSISDVSKRVASAYIDDVEKLSRFIRKLQQEINVFVFRKEQFNEAKALVTPSFGLFPSVSTTSVMLSFRVNDSNGSDLTKVFVHLTYQSHKYLPEEPKFMFCGGDPEAQATFKRQLHSLEFMPLREAIIAAFPNAEKLMSSSTCSENVPSTQPNEKEEALTKSGETIEEPITPSSPVRSRPKRSSVKEKLQEKPKIELAAAEQNQDVESPADTTPPTTSRSQRGRGRGKSVAEGQTQGKPRGRGRGRKNP